MNTDLVPLPPELLATEDAFDVGLIPSEGDLPEPVQRWHIDGTGSAAWAMAHVARAESALSDLQAQAIDWYGRIDAWLAHEAAPHRATVAFFEAHLERYALELREVDPKARTLVLPTGKVSTRSTSPKVTVTDEAAVIAWADDFAPEAVARDPKVKLTELRRHVIVKEMLTHAWITHSCGCKVSVSDEEGLDIPPVGTGIECSECGAEALIGMVEPLASKLLPVTVDGGFVPGVDVDPGGVTASVSVS